MLYANWNGQKVQAQPGLKGATCPGCSGPVISKCGSLVAYHFAHLNRDCDAWSEPETDWHIRWKEVFPTEWREVKLGQHRADVHTAHDITVEFQHSPITFDEVMARTNFYCEYGGIVWVLDAAQADIHFWKLRKPDYYNFRWHSARRAFKRCTSSLWLDLGTPTLFCIEFIEKPWKRCWEGIGFAMSKSRFINHLLNHCVTPDLNQYDYA